MQLRIAESLNITAHRPPMNKDHLHSSTDDAVGWIVFNFGRRRSLFPEVSYWRHNTDDDDWAFWKSGRE